MTEPRTPKTTKRGPGRKPDVTRQDWLTKGLSELGLNGPGALTLDSLCQKLGITKGSFYWHFASRDEFMKLLLEEWEKRDTLALIEHVEAQGGTPLEKLHALFLAANSGRVDFRIEQAIRHWGHRETSIRQMLLSADRKRTDYMAGLFGELGADDATAMTQTTLLYALIFGEAIIYRREDASTRLARREAAFWAIARLGPAPAPAHSDH